MVLEHLESIDFVIGFDDETPIDLIKFFKPNIIFKGSDYKINQVVGSEFISKIGGEAKLIDFENAILPLKLLIK